jgi:Ca2+-binding EF-hand superfamily protein
MKSARIALAVLLIGSSAAFAQVNLDDDGDGKVTLAEMQGMYPDVTEAQFNEFDADGSGALDANELAAAIEAELIPDQD